MALGQVDNGVKEFLTKEVWTSGQNKKNFLVNYEQALSNYNQTPLFSQRELQNGRTYISQTQTKDPILVRELQSAKRFCLSVRPYWTC